MMTSPVYPIDEWPRSSPESQGISGIVLLNILQKIEKSGHNVHALLIVRRGRLLFEHYFAPYTASTTHTIRPIFLCHM